MHRDIVCVGCGVKLQTGQKYCHECGEEGTRPESSTNNSRRPRSAIARWASRNLSEEQLEGLIGRCEGWEEKYEEGVEAGEVEVINNKK